MVTETKLAHWSLLSQENVTVFAVVAGHSEAFDEERQDATQPEPGDEQKRTDDPR